MGSSSNKSLPTKSEIYNKNEENNRINANLACPPLPVTSQPNLSFSNKPSEKCIHQDNNKKNNINNNIPQNNHNKPQQQISQNHVNQNPMGPYINVQPVPIPFPVNNPGYAMPYYPGGIYPQPYPYPYYGPIQQVNSAIVLPPGYKPDYSPGYSPWGNLSEDLDNLF